MLCRSKGCRERHDLLLLLSESSFQKRVTRLAQIHLSVVGNNRHSCDELKGHLCLGHDEVDLSKVSCCIQKVRDIRSHELCELQQDAQNLALLREFKFLYLVVELHDFRRLDICGLSCGGLIVDETCQALLVCCAYRDQHLSVAYGHSCVAVHNSFLLCPLEDRAHSSGYCAFLLAEGPADLIQDVGCGVLDVSVSVDDALYSSLDFRETHDRCAHPLEIRVDTVLDVLEEGGNLP